MRSMLAPIIVLAASLTAVSAWGLGPETPGPTPYGAPCPLCRNYGQCGRMLSFDESATQLKEFYAEKGLAVRNIEAMRPNPPAGRPAEAVSPRPGMGEGMGRFLGADVFDGERLVDRVVFDRMTGRMRSIY